MNSDQPPIPKKIQAKGLAENSDELTRRRLFSFELILVFFRVVTVAVTFSGTNAQPMWNH